MGRINREVKYLCFKASLLVWEFLGLHIVLSGWGKC